MTGNPERIWVGPLEQVLPYRGERDDDGHDPRISGYKLYFHEDKYKALVERIQKLENVDYDMLIDLLSETMADQINGHNFINEHATEIVEVLKPYLSTKIIHNTKMESI